MHRFLMLGLLVAVQVMAPFIHAHAGVVHGGHVQFLHVHGLMQGAAVDESATCPAHGAEIAVAQGLPARDLQMGVAAASPALLPFQSSVAEAGRESVGVAPQSWPDWPPSEHARPPALAPPGI